MIIYADIFWLVYIFFNWSNIYTAPPDNIRLSTTEQPQYMFVENAIFYSLGIVVENLLLGKNALMQMPSAVMLGW